MPNVTVVAEEGPITLTFTDLVNYHGHGALAMLAITFRAQEVAFARLCGDVAPARTDTTVTSGHPGPGVRDAFEMVTRCVTRGAYAVDRFLPGPRLNPDANVVYAFEIAVAGRGVQHVDVRAGVLPEEFFTHLRAAPADKDPAAFALVRRAVAEKVLAEPDPENLFDLPAPAIVC